MRNKEIAPALVRVALYIRVSGEEQKIKGLSLEAQQERLEAYARERGWVIVGIYIDAAKTARKNIHKIPFYPICIIKSNLLLSLQGGKNGYY